MHALKHLARRYRLIMLAMLFTASVIANAGSIERLGISGLWYIQDRLDLADYRYGNAFQELTDPANMQWLNARSGLAGNAESDARDNLELSARLAHSRLVASRAYADSLYVHLGYLSESRSLSFGPVLDTED